MTPSASASPHRILRRRRSDNRLVFHALFLLITSKANAATDFAFPDLQISDLAFGSCHKARARRTHNKKHQIYFHANAFRNIPSDIPVWIWTGDAVYPPKRGISSVELLRREYDNMKHNGTLGYGDFVRDNKIVLGTWDDHDYGGNDMGNNMPNRSERADAYWDFIGRRPQSSLGDDTARAGVYSSATFGEPPRQVKVILLDTRWHRQEYCLPSVATRIPMGAGISCAFRWLSAGLLNGICSKDRSMLGAEQWKWLEDELDNSKASIHVIVSSVQVLTTNPAMESWGHFPNERRRLLAHLSNVSGAVLLSGDVHHGEILDPRKAFDELHDKDRHEQVHRSSFLEVTSSGLTHVCSQQGMYGALCKPLLTLFHRHRFHSIDNFYLQPNFGTLQVNWDAETFRVNVHSVDTGTVVLTTGDRHFAPRVWTDKELDLVLPVMNGNLKPLAWSVIAATVMLWVIWRRQQRSSK